MDGMIRKNNLSAHTPPGIASVAVLTPIQFRLIQYQAYYNFTVFPGNTYDYSPFNASVQSRFYNNLYRPGNCVDQIKDCAARSLDEIYTATAS